MSDPNASPIDEVVEHEAEGTRGWNDGGDGWVNLVAAEEDDATNAMMKDYLTAVKTAVTTETQAAYRANAEKLQAASA